MSVLFVCLVVLRGRVLAVGVERLSVLCVCVYFEWFVLLGSCAGDGAKDIRRSSLRVSVCPVRC